MLGSLYAERHGMEVICIRIGSFQANLAENQPRSAKFLSQRDCVQLFERAILAENI
jgi:hypothetical protein